jgi:hypothetical protein
VLLESALLGPQIEKAFSPTPAKLSTERKKPMSESEIISNQKTILQNQATIIANQNSILQNQDAIKSNQSSLDKILKHQELILAALKK